MMYYLSVNSKDDHLLHSIRTRLHTADNTEVQRLARGCECSAHKNYNGKDQRRKIVDRCLFLHKMLTQTDCFVFFLLFTCVCYLNFFKVFPLNCEWAIENYLFQFWLFFFYSVFFSFFRDSVFFSFIYTKQR